MARGILDEFGPDRANSRSGRAKTGGIKKFRDVRNYQTPQGPTSISNRGPGLGGDNLGYCGTQGKHGTDVSESGSPGLGGERRGMGENRKG